MILPKWMNRQIEINKLGKAIAYDRTAVGYSNMADLRAALEV